MLGHEAMTENLSAHKELWLLKSFIKMISGLFYKKNLHQTYCVLRLYLLHLAISFIPKLHKIECLNLYIIVGIKFVNLFNPFFLRLLFHNDCLYCENSTYNFKHDWN